MSAGVKHVKVFIQMLGPFEVFRDGEKLRPADFGSRKARTLLRWLADARNTVVPEDTLLHTLWPDTPADKVLRSFRVRVSELRRLLAPVKGSVVPLERVENGFILRTIPGQLETDVDHFVTLTSDSLQRPPDSNAIPLLKQSIDLYKGKYFSDDPYSEHWYATRERYQKLFVTAAERLAAIHESLSQYTEGIHLLQQLIDRTDPDEGLYRSLIRLQYLQGDQTGALRTFDECRAYLQSEIGIRPMPQTVRLITQVLRHEPLDPLFSSDGDQSSVSDRSVSGKTEEWPFLGRKAELSDLKRHVNELQNGQGAIVRLHGPSGIGKTRLMKEAIAHASRDRPMRTMWIQGSHLNSRIPFASIVDGFQIGLNPVLSSEQTESLMAVSSPHVRQLMGWAPRLTPDQRVQPEAIDDLLLHREMLTLFEQLTQQLPLILCIDDVQTLDPASRSLLLALARRVIHFPLLIMMTCHHAPQDDELGMDLSKIDKPSTVIHLEPLSASALSPLAGRGLLNPWTHRWLQQLHSDTAGKPYSLIQKLNALKSKNLIDIHGGEIVFPSGLFELMTGVPTQDEPHEHSTGRRDDFDQSWRQLSDDARSLLQKAAVLRDSLTLERLQRLATKSTAAFEQVVEQLIRHGYFVIEGLDSAGHLKLSFTHSHLQHRTYQTLSRPERLWYHRRVFELLQTESEQFVTESAISHARRLSATAQHALLAENWKAAAKWSLQAAAAASSIVSGPEVAILCRQALQAAERMKSPAQTELLHEARLALGKALLHIGSLEEALPLFETIAHTSDNAETVLPLNQHLMAIYLYLNQFDKASALVNRLHAAAGDNERVRVWADIARANIHYRSGEALKSIAISQNVLDHFRDDFPGQIITMSQRPPDLGQNETLSQADAHHQLALSYWDLGRYDKALRHARQCVDLRQDGVEPGFINSLNMLGELYQDLFCTKLAHKVHQEALDLSLNRGKVSYSIEIWRNIGLNFVHEGRIEKGLQTLERIWQQVQDLKLAPYWQENHLRSLLEANILAHRPNEVRTLLDLYKKALGPRETPFVTIFSFALALLEGRMDEGDAVLNHVQTFWEQTGRRGRAAHVLLFAGQEFMLHGDNARSQKYLTLAIDELDRICDLVPKDIAEQIRSSRQYVGAQRLLASLVFTNEK